MFIGLVSNAGIPLAHGSTVDAMQYGLLQKPFWSYYTLSNFSRVKPIAWVLRESEKHAAQDAADDAVLMAAGVSEGTVLHTGPRRLQKRLGPFDLVFYGVGSTVGAGIYSLIGPGLQTAGERVPPQRFHARSLLLHTLSVNIVYNLCAHMNVHGVRPP